MPAGIRMPVKAVAEAVCPVPAMPAVACVQCSPHACLEFLADCPLFACVGCPDPIGPRPRQTRRARSTGRAVSIDVPDEALPSLGEPSVHALKAAILLSLS
jgi:hypothetical protein